MPDFFRALLALALCLTLNVALAADTALDRLARYVEIDTSNPPGNESRGIAFLAGVLDAAGISYHTAESAPGRGNLWARLHGGDAPALVLLHHVDVVPATAAAWQTPPFTAVSTAGNLAGRGALDTKGLGIAHLEAFLALHRSGAALTRDVIFMATADEEAGGALGAGWLVEHHPESFAGAGFLLNEGGAGIATEGGLRFQIELAQKRPLWLRLVASDRPGHGSSPRPTSAPGRLVAALERIRTRPFPARVIAPVERMFAGIAAQAGDEWAAPFADIRGAIADEDFLARLQAAKPHLHALLRNTCSITVLAGSSKVNVVPPTASAELDCRILPDQDAAAFLADITTRVADDAIRIEPTLSFAAAASAADTALFRLLARVSTAHYPGAAVVPTVAGGFTDSHYFRERGITSYGYAPFVIPEADLGGVHGNDERIGIASFERGVAMMTEIVRAFATADGER
ncbi:MAG: M20/M25/M40 family metallo-hydrolase [Gammaproteobacteria bacterium]|nr:M20/M25/M40 family metallo-hydrolase [Gammaproteobacteria bacterium]MCP5201902.1 M20/M25/M40 family metallo-hydrolase [Gammaproteobacteria bacterium]